MSTLQVIAGSLAGIIVAALTLWGVIKTAAAARTGVARTSHVDAQADALKAWQALNKPLQDELDRVNRRLTAVLAEQVSEKAKREERDEDVQDQLSSQSSRIDTLTSEVKHWKSMAKAIARWATTLRDQVISLGGSVPTIPDELLLAQLLDDEDDRH